MMQAKVSKIKEVVLEKIYSPVAEPGKAVVNVYAVGICGSDVHIYLGENPVIKPPWVCGHEFGGVIKSLSEVDRENSKFNIGDKVVVNPVINCGFCYYCRHEAEHMCENQQVIGGTQDGAMKEEILVPIKNLVRLNDSFDLLYSPIIEPLAVAIHAIGQIKNSNIVIIGLGTVGLLEQQICIMNGNKVFALDINNFSLELSMKLGACSAINFNEILKNNHFEKFFCGKKIDIVVDNVCSKETLKFSLDIVRKKGRIVLVGIPSKNFEINILKFLCNEIIMTSSYLYRDSEFIRAANYISENKIDFNSIISKVFPLNLISKAFEYKINHPSIKVIIKI